MFCKHAFACLVLVLAATAAKGQTDPVTGLPADGSQAAREAMPGFVYMVRYEDVFLAGIREQNNGQWVASDNPLSAYGRIRESGNIVVGHTFDIPLGTLIDSGVLKNPGPAPLQLELFTPAGAEVIEVAPGWAVQVGTVRADVLLGTHETGCMCKCTWDTGYKWITTTCCPTDEPNFCFCSCRDHLPCYVDEQTVGNTNASCKDGLIMDMGTGN